MTYLLLTKEQEEIYRRCLVNGFSIDPLQFRGFPVITDIIDAREIKPSMETFIFDLKQLTEKHPCAHCGQVKE